MTRPIKRFRQLILCLTLISFFLGMYFNSNFEFPVKLPLMLTTEAFTLIVYASFTYCSKKEPQNRAARMFFRIVLAFLMMYGPQEALRGCYYEARRDYTEKRPGIYTYEQIKCRDVERAHTNGNDIETTILPLFRLYRARCILPLTVCVLMVVEMVIYGLSDEALGLPQDDAALAETRNDIELSVSESRKTVLPDPLLATALYHR